MRLTLLNRVCLTGSTGLFLGVNSKAIRDNLCSQSDKITIDKDRIVQYIYVKSIAVHTTEEVVSLGHWDNSPRRHRGRRNSIG